MHIEHESLYERPACMGGRTLREKLGLSPHRYTLCDKGKDLKRERGITAQDIIIHDHVRRGWKRGMGFVPNRKAVV